MLLLRLDPRNPRRTFGTGSLFTRARFQQAVAKVRRIERRETRILTAFAIAAGIGQLPLIKYLEARFDHGKAIAIEGVVFLLYLAIVVWLIYRLNTRTAAVRPRCPQCGARLQGMSERVAMATGKCDKCGGKVFK